MMEAFPSNLIKMDLILDPKLIPLSYRPKASLGFVLISKQVVLNNAMHRALRWMLNVAPLTLSSSPLMFAVSSCPSISVISLPRPSVDGGQDDSW